MFRSASKPSTNSDMIRNIRQVSCSLKSLAMKGFPVTPILGRAMVRLSTDFLGLRVGMVSSFKGLGDNGLRLIFQGILDSFGVIRDQGRQLPDIKIFYLAGFLTGRQRSTRDPAKK